MVAKLACVHLVERGRHEARECELPRHWDHAHPMGVGSVVLCKSCGRLWRLFRRTHWDLLKWELVEETEDGFKPVRTCGFRTTWGV